LQQAQNRALCLLLAVAGCFGNSKGADFFGAGQVDDVEHGTLFREMMGPTLPQLRARMDEVIKISLNFEALEIT